MQERGFSPSGGCGFRVGGTRRFVLRCLYVVLPVPPHFFGLAQRNGVEPQRKTLLGWWRPREVSGPTRLSHSRGSCHSAAEVSASRTDWITRPRGEGLGLNVDWRLKVFCPAFLQKSGRGPGAEPWPRAAARGTSFMLHKAQEGVKGGTLAGGSPFAGGSAARSPCDAIPIAVILRRARGGPLHYGKIKNARHTGARFLARKEGFEPSLGSTPTTPLAGEPLRPLGYFRRSKLTYIIIWIAACQD